MTTREELNQLVSSLPDGALDRAKQALEHLQTWPPRMPDALARGRDAALARMQERTKEHMQRMADRAGGVGGGIAGFVSMAGGGGSVRDGKRYGRQSFGYEDEEGKAYETIIVQADRELRVTERLRLDEQAGIMTMKLVMLGPDQTAATFEHTFRLPPEPKAE
jgi:hypothetical protein